VTEPLETVRRWPGGRWVAIAGGLAGIVVFAFTIGPNTLYGALWRAAVAAGVVMGALSVIQRFWGGAEVDEVELPGGWRIRFTQTVSRSIRVLTGRVIVQLEDLDARVYALEQDVSRLKGGTPDADAQE